MKLKPKSLELWKTLAEPTKSKYIKTYPSENVGKDVRLTWPGGVQEPLPLGFDKLCQEDPRVVAKVIVLDHPFTRLRQELPNQFGFALVELNGSSKLSVQGRVQDFAASAVFG